MEILIHSLNGFQMCETVENFFLYKYGTVQNFVDKR
jgi:hypothetical protein